MTSRRMSRSGDGRSLSIGGSLVQLLTQGGQAVMITNTENNVQIQRMLSANFQIDNYQDIANMSGLHQELSDLAHQILTLQGLGRH